MNFVMFLDESGDHNLRRIDRNFPVFCLMGCVFERYYYRDVVRPTIDAFKLLFRGRTDVILHSREIRKHQGAFSFLGDESTRSEFYDALNELIRSLRFTVLSAVILKLDHLSEYGLRARHPYHLALEFILERYSLLMSRRGRCCSGYVLAESRGKREDSLLKAEFSRLSAVGTRYQDLRNVTGLWMEKKPANLVGLQIADLAAYPIAAKVLRPLAEQRSFDVLVDKISAAPERKGGSILGYGLKVFPQPTFDHFQLWGEKTEHGP